MSARVRVDFAQLHGAGDGCNAQCTFQRVAGCGASVTQQGKVTRAVCATPCRSKGTKTSVLRARRYVVVVVRVLITGARTARLRGAVEKRVLPANFAGFGVVLQTVIVGNCSAPEALAHVNLALL